MRNLLKDLLFAAVVGFLVLGAATVFTNRPPAQALSSAPTACVTPKVWLKTSNGIANPQPIIVTPPSGAKITGITMSVTQGTGTWYGLLFLTDGATNMGLGMHRVPAGAGHGTGVATHNYLMMVAGLPQDSDGNTYLLMTPTHTLNLDLGSASSGHTNTGLQVMVTGCQFE